MQYLTNHPIWCVHQMRPVEVVINRAAGQDISSCLQIDSLSGQSVGLDAREIHIWYNNNLRLDGQQLETVRRTAMVGGGFRIRSDNGVDSGQS